MWMSSSIATAAAAPLQSIAKDESCGCFAKAVESIKQQQFKTVNTSVSRGTVTSQPTWSRQSMIKAMKSCQVSAFAGIETVWLAAT